MPATILNNGDEFRPAPAFQIDRFSNEARPDWGVSRFKKNLLIVLNDLFAPLLERELRKVFDVQGLNKYLYKFMQALHEAHSAAAPPEEIITIDLNETMADELLDILKRVNAVDGVHANIFEFIGDLEDTLNDGHVSEAAQRRKAAS